MRTRRTNAPSTHRFVVVRMAQLRHRESVTDERDDKHPRIAAHRHAHAVGAARLVFVDGRRLPPGERTLLHAGCRLGFGREGGHELVDASEPTAFAVPLAGNSTT